jgi:hypothetical protein
LNNYPGLERARQQYWLMETQLGSITHEIDVSSNDFVSVDVRHVLLKHDDGQLNQTKLCQIIITMHTMNLNVLGSVVLLLLLGTVLQFSFLHVNKEGVTTASLEIEGRMRVPRNNVTTTNLLPSLSSVDDITKLTYSVKQTRSDQQFPEAESSAISVRKKTPYPVVIGPEEAFMWNGAQSRLCKRINREQRKLDKHTLTNNATVHLYLQLSCERLHQRNQHGNILLGFYGMKLAALYFHADFTFRCSEDTGQEPSSLNRNRNYLFWWLQTNSKVREIIHPKAAVQHNLINETLYDPPHPPGKSACVVSLRR